MLVRAKNRPPQHKMQGGEPPRPAQSQVFTYPSPSKGWMTAGNLQAAPLDACQRMDNFFPTAQGGILRKGSRKHATLDAGAVRMFRFAFGSDTALFSSTASAIYEIESPADEDTAETPIISRLGSGDWSTTQFGNSGGVFMVAVNGTDYAWYWDGTEAQPIADEDIHDLAYDALTGEFTVNQTVTGGTSGASAKIIAVHPTSDTAGTLKVGTITGTFQNNEALTDSLTGAATSDIPSGTSTASTVAITGINTYELSQIWSHKSRLFFIERNSLKAHYLPVDSIGGAVSSLNLAPIFRKGGNLLFGATWSMDSGDGLDDKCVFVTDEGEVAVYGGTNPSSASTWALEGVYELGNPIDKHAHFRLGGEVMIVTDDGIFPLSQAVFTAYEQLFDRALTRPIEDEWRLTVANRSSADPVTATIWQSQGFLLVSTPEKVGSLNASYVCNTRYGTWSRYIGWNVDCATEHNDKFYFADENGSVYQGEVGGEDAGSAYTGHIVPKFSDLGTPGKKVVSQIGLLCRSTATVTYAATALKDYENRTLPTPQATAVDDSASVWGTAEWGTAIWGSDETLDGSQIWKSAGTTGYSISPAISITSNNTVAPRIEIVGIQVRFEVGSPL